MEGEERRKCHVSNSGWCTLTNWRVVVFRAYHQLLCLRRMDLDWAEHKVVAAKELVERSAHEVRSR